ncbi:hypothetical protein [Streptomyces sp. NPDC005283]|uniref:hypothetical protein n=1 Tax=Streptomyces sp. NPDC005283 TaxID=3156871 RepID=UPI0034546537
MGREPLVTAAAQALTARWAELIPLQSRKEEPGPMRPQREPTGCMYAIGMFYALCGLVLVLSLIGGIFTGDSDPEPIPAPATETTWVPNPSPSWTEPLLPDDALESPPPVCVEADARGVIPRDRWTPCGQLLGYFDGWTTPPPNAPGVIMEP